MIYAQNISNGSSIGNNEAQAAFILRHDDITYPPDFILEEEQRNVRGQYFVVTELCEPSVMPDRIAWAVKPWRNSRQPQRIT